jgi:hypothetical protein
LITHQVSPIPHRVRNTPRNDQVGLEESFWVTDQVSGYHQVRARLVYETPHLYVYLQDGVTANLNALMSSANLFEQHSLPTDEATYGQPWTPGVDDDTHITLLNAQGLGPVGGYFSSEDEYPRAVFQYSNERQMIYVNLDPNSGEVPGEEFYNATLAHEFQHMIHWFWHPADPSWTNEGMSVLAQHINHFGSGGVDQDFLGQPDTMLGGWTDDQSADLAHYGAGYLFMDYFAEHYSGYSILRDLLIDPAQVPLNFDDVLAAHGYADRFNDVFAKFAIAILLNDPSVAGGIYAYPTITGERAIAQHLVSSYPFADGTAAVPATVHQYATEYYDFHPAGGRAQTLAISFSGNPYICIVNNQPDGGSANEWWSNSGNDMASTLTRPFDLSSLAGQRVTLTFHAWYDLEPDFDYAYVEISTDGGQNWTTLPASTSSETNPNGANYGHGITSPMVSPAGCNLARQWVPETVDLSAYAERKIQLRFETITDDAVHCQGLALDNIAIPQLGFKDDLGSANGWQAAGFIRSNNLLAEQYVLQAVIFPAGGGAPTVRPVAVDPQTGQATLSLAGFGGTIAHVVLAVSALAPTTVVPARYQLSAHLT